MKKKYEIHLGQRFGRLTVLSEIPRPPRYARRALCFCDCGNQFETEIYPLFDGRTQSCGCYNHEIITIHGHTPVGRRTPTWSSWRSMMTRCYLPTMHCYARYGGRGIVVCDEWRMSEGQGFINFLSDMGERPDGRTLDRKDSNGNYEPANCRWATPSVQIRHLRKLSDDQVRAIRRLLAQGVPQSEIASRIGTKSATVSKIRTGEIYREEIGI